MQSSLFLRYENKLIDYYQLVDPSSSLSCKGHVELASVVIEDAVTKVNGRSYLDDFKPFSDLFTLKSIFMHFVKASLIPVNLIVHEYNVHLMDSLELDESKREEFDWNESLMKNFALFFNILIIDNFKLIN